MKSKNVNQMSLPFDDVFDWFPIIQKMKDLHFRTEDSGYIEKGLYIETYNSTIFAYKDGESKRESISFQEAKNLYRLSAG